MSTKVEPKWKSNLKAHVLCDINGIRKEYFFPSPDFITNALNVSDADRPLWYCLFNAGVFNMIHILLLYYVLYNRHWTLIALTTIAKFVIFAVPRYFLALHFSSHSPCMKPNWLNTFYIEWLLAPLYGLPPATYSSHHVIMHHREDNICPRDLSSTMPYQRDNFLHFIHYWIRFEFAVWVELPYYLWTAGHISRCCLSLTGELMWIYANILLWKFRPAFMLWILFLPQFLLSFLLMFGNFAQHMFIDPYDYENDHLLTVNMINNEYNQLTFNDGYHIIHHKYPILHWSQIPIRFITDNELQSHADAKYTVCFTGIDYWWFAVYIMTGQLKRLAKDHFLPCNDMQASMTEEQIVQFFENKLKVVKKRNY